MCAGGCELMGKRTDEDERRSITIKVRVSPREKAVIEANARTSSRSVSAFMRERSLGLHVGDQVAHIVFADLRRTAINLHRLAEAAGDEQVESSR